MCWCVWGSGEHGLDGASICKQQSGCHLITVSLKITRAMLRWDTVTFPFQGQLFYTPSIIKELYFSRKQPTMGGKRGSHSAAVFKTSFGFKLFSLWIINLNPDRVSKAFPHSRHFFFFCPPLTYFDVSVTWKGTLHLETDSEKTHKKEKDTKSHRTVEQISPQTKCERNTSAKESMGNYYLFSIWDHPDYSTGWRVLIINVDQLTTLPQWSRQTISLPWQAPQPATHCKSNEFEAKIRK